MSVVDNCKKCDAFCCRHIAVHIDKPVTEEDVDHIRWYLLHKNVWVSIGLDDSWLLEFRTPCNNIRDDFKCADYENRPLICREYPGIDELCERQTDEKSYTCLFKNEKEFCEYIMAHKKGISSGMRKTLQKVIAGKKKT